MFELIQSFDESVMLFVQEHLRCGALNFIMIFFTTIGDAGLVWLLMALGLMITRKYRVLGFDMLVCIALCYCLNDLVIKPIVQRPRPFLAIQELAVLVKRPGSFSFPSGHACSSFACAYVITKTKGKKAAWFYALAGMIALSRPYVGVHYPSDILVGALVGTLGAAVLLYLRRRFVPAERWLLPRRD